MNLKRSPFAIQDKNTRDLDNAKDYPTIADLMREQKVSNNDTNTEMLVSSSIAMTRRLTHFVKINVILRPTFHY